MKEIGGYLELDELISNPLHKQCIELNSGRAALLHLILNKKIKTLYLPFYLCDSVFNYIKHAEIEIRFYHINSNFYPMIESIEENTTIYIVNHFGFISNEIIKDFRRKYNKIIIDNTHAFFLEPLKDIDTIYSCRKFFGVPDGAYLYSNIKHDEKMNINKVANRVGHIIGREENSASDFYQDHIKNDKFFENDPIQCISNFSKKILGAIDYSSVKNKRNENFNHLRNNLDIINLLDIKLLDSISPGQFCYPFLSDRSESLRKKLIAHRIYIPTLWPNVNGDYGANSFEYNSAYNILPIPCDQRYQKSDMDNIINIIKNEE